VDVRHKFARAHAVALLAVVMGALGMIPIAGAQPRLRVIVQRPLPVLAQQQGVKIYDGGYGSAVAIDPREARHFYLLTGRGPNVDTAIPDQRMFFAPEYAPRIGRFEITPQGLRLVSFIELRTYDGRKLSGLPLPPGLASTGEIPVDAQGRPLKFDPEGIDPGGLVAMSDRTFWISDKYGPFLLHVNENGRTIERIGPIRGTVRAMPRVFALRRPNRGMAGLTVLPGGTVIVGIMQSPLDNPTPSVRRASRVARILAYDTRNSSSKQYIYLQEESGLANADIAAISATRLLVLEHDGRFPGDADAPTRVKRVYLIDISGATDVSDREDSPHGRVANSQTLEEMTPFELRAAGIVPVTKTLIVDLLALPHRYPHDKPEGLALLGDRTIAVANDDDYGITSAGGALAPKRAPGTPLLIDRGSLYIITLERPLGE
jgi:phytase-like protein